MMRKISHVCVLLMSIIITGDAMRILVVFPMVAKSHNILGRGVVKHLLEAGHEVVYITSYPSQKPIQNLKEIDVSSIGLEFKKQMDKHTGFKLQNLVGKSNAGESSSFMFFVYAFHREFLEHNTTRSFLSDRKEKFDAVVLEWFFSETIAGIPPLFQCPLIWFGSTEAHGQILRIIDEVPNPAYNADLFSTAIPPFTFWERMAELMNAVKKQFVVNFITYSFERALYNDVFPEIGTKRGVTMPSYEEAIYNASLMFVNSDPSIGTAFRLPPNVKYIGGFHIDDNVKPLPDDLQKLMDQTEHGVIYFSMGSNLNSKDMSTSMKQSLLKMFGTLREDVIWKFEEDMDDVPKNVHLVQWAPQQSILAHPNLKLFITHGGQLSTTEAIHFGVPMVGIPVLGDQHVNMKAVVNRGLGVTVKLAEDMAGELAAAIDKLLRNPVYKTKAKYLSSIYHDRMVHPGKELVYWIEHVVKTQGALHLRSKALMVTWYQKYYLDCLGLMLLVSYLVFCILKLTYRKIRSKNTRKIKTK